MRKSYFCNTTEERTVVLSVETLLELYNSALSHVLVMEINFFQSKRIRADCHGHIVPSLKLTVFVL